MRFTWDPEKRNKIWNERKVDLLMAAQMFSDPESVVVAEDDRKDYGEVRVNAVGRSTDGNWYHLTYTERGDEIHLITAWRLSDDSKKRYEERYARRP